MVQVDDDMNGHLALDSTVEALTKLMNLWNKRTRSHLAFGKKDIGDLKEVMTEQDLIPGILAVKIQSFNTTPCICISPEE